MRLVLLLLPAIASAEDHPHVNAGMEIGVGVDSNALVARVHAGASHAFGAGPARPSIGVGMTFGAGRVERRGVMQARHVDYGPELQLGVDFGDRGLVTNRVFATVARTGGWRLGIGANIAQLAARAGREPGHGYVLLVIPQQLEVTWSSDRVAVTFSYGL